MKKAKSRLVSKKKPQPQTEIQRRLLHGYLVHLPLLFIGVLLYLVVCWIIYHVSPGSIANIFLVGTYLPLTVIFFLGNISLFSYIFQNTRRGLLTAILIQIVIFLKLQKVVIELYWLLPLTAVFTLAELAFTKMRTKTSN